MMPVNINTLSQATSRRQSLARHGLGTGLDIGWWGAELWLTDLKVNQTSSVERLTALAQDFDLALRFARVAVFEMRVHDDQTVVDSWSKKKGPTAQLNATTAHDRRAAAQYGIAEAELTAARGHVGHTTRLGGQIVIGLTEQLQR